MRILHTADWHIGRNLAGFDLLEVQQRSFEQLRAVARAQNVDAIIIAGDLYDRALANEAVVRSVNKMLQELNLEDQLPLLAISGNHDSAERLGTGATWFANTNFYLNTRLAGAFEPVTLGDTQFFLLPFFEPREVEALFEDANITSVAKAMAAIVARMQTLFAADTHHVLVAHFFAAGSTHSASETTVSVGGLDAVPTDVLAPFDYVALGHLHNRHALHAVNAQYAGSLVKFDKSETEQEKGCYILDTDTMKRTFIPVVQEPEFHHVTAAFDDIVAGAIPDVSATDYVHVTLTDKEVIPDLMNRLRKVYPLCTGVDRKTGVNVKSVVHTFNKSLSPLDLLEQFYQDVEGETMATPMREWAQTTLKEAEGVE